MAFKSVKYHLTIWSKAINEKISIYTVELLDILDQGMEFCVQEPSILYDILRRFERITIPVLYKHITHINIWYVSTGKENIQYKEY